MSEPLERIERYLLGQMPDDEKQLFEQEMQGDPALQESVKRMRILHAALEVSVEEDLKSHLQVLRTQDQHDASVPNRVVIRRRLFFRVAAAASVVLAIGAGLWWILQWGKTDMTMYAALHYQSFDPAVLRGTADSTLALPFDLIADETQRDSAIQWLQTWMTGHPDDHEARFILADLLKQAGRIAEAQFQFAQIIDARSIRWGQKAEWNYLMLSLPLGGDTLATRLLKGMTQHPDHSYHRQALDLESRFEK